jgi:hypothetical protein
VASLLVAAGVPAEQWRGLAAAGLGTVQSLLELHALPASQVGNKSVDLPFVAHVFSLPALRLSLWLFSARAVGLFPVSLSRFCLSVSSFFTACGLRVRRLFC